MASKSKAAAATKKEKDDLVDKRDELYNRCAEQGLDRTFTQANLVGMNVAKDLDELMKLVQGLAHESMLQIMTLDGEVCYKFRERSDATKLAGLDEREHMVYQMIEASGVQGIWTKTLKARTNLHQTVMTKILKNLEIKEYVKAVKSVKFPGRKMYMLYGLNPGEEVTGGTWFSDGELDVEFVEMIANIVTRHVKQISWRLAPRPAAPNKLQKTSKSATASSSSAQPPPDPTLELDIAALYPRLGPVTERKRPLLPQPPDRPDTYPSAHDILRWIGQQDVIQGKELALSDLHILLDMLVFDGRLERLGIDRRLDADEAESAVADATYRWARRPDDEEDEDENGLVKRSGPGNGFSDAPCSRCPVYRLCEEGGPVNARTCGYFADWLDAC